MSPFQGDSTHLHVHLYIVYMMHSPFTMVIHLFGSLYWMSHTLMMPTQGFTYEVSSVFRILYWQGEVFKTCKNDISERWCQVLWVRFAWLPASGVFFPLIPAIWAPKSDDFMQDHLYISVSLTHPFVFFSVLFQLVFIPASCEPFGNIPRHFFGVAIMNKTQRFLELCVELAPQTLSDWQSNID